MIHVPIRHLALKRAFFVGFFSCVASLLIAQAPLKTDNITVSTPVMGQKFATENIRVQGELSPEAGDFLINNQLVTITPEGRFSHPIILASEGENQITLQVFNKKRLFLQPVLLEELALFVDYAPNPVGVIPQLTILSPEEGLSTNKNLILFKGEIKNATKATLDGEPIDLDTTGKFYVKKTITAVNTPQTFVIEAISNDNVKALEKRTVTYIPDRLSKPTITLTTPEDNQFIEEGQVVLKGMVANATQFLINDRLITLDKSGKFSYTETLFKKNQYYTFSLVATSDDNQKTTLTRRIYSKAKEPLPGVETSQKSNPVIPPLVSDLGDSLSESDDTTDVLIKRLPDIPKTIPDYIPESVKSKLNKKITLELEGADLKDVLKIISKKSGLNIVADNSLNGNVNIILYDTSIKDTIDYLLDTQGLSYRIVDNTILIASDRKLDTPTQLDSAIIKLNNTDAEALVGILKTYLTKGESVQFSKANNLIILYADKRKLIQLTSIIQGIDAQEEPQVFLEVQVIETSTTALKSRGIAWPSSIGLGVQANITNTGTTIQSNPSFQALIQMLESDGLAKILARPRLKAVNNEQAEIFIGERIPITQTTVDTTGRVAENVSFVDTGILLRVLPNINPVTREVKLRIQPEVSVISGFRGANNDKPVIRSRKVNTSVWVKDGETVIIGGLFNSADTKDITKIPLIGSVPILGNLFSSSRKDKSQTELIITVTPKIVGRGQVYYPQEGGSSSEIKTKL